MICRSGVAAVQPRGGDRSGSGLIVAIWVISLLSLLVSSFAFEAHIEARITSYYRKRTKAEHLARSGIDLAHMLMVKSREVDLEATEEPEDDLWYKDAKRLAQGDTVTLEEPLGEGVIRLTVVTELARRDINNLGSNEDDITENLERILTVGGITEEMGLWPTLIDSFLDWTDKDDEERIDGAETENYYDTLEPPYSSKNGTLDTVEELLLVKGFTRTILYGGVIESSSVDGEPVTMAGIYDLLTTYGGSKININAASMRVLMTLPGVDEIIAGAIIEQREGLEDEYGVFEPEPFDGPEDLVEKIEELDLAEMKKYVTDAAATYFRIDSVGDVGGVERGVWCIVRYDGTTLKVLRWREEP